MSKVRVGINGFGRIGRVLFRQAFGHSDLEIVAVNDPHDVESEAHLLKYDSVYGPYPGKVEVDGDFLVIDGTKVKTYAELDPKKIPWKEHRVDIVIDCTGVFREREQLAWHLEAGAKKVILSAPPKGDIDSMLCMGVNEGSYDHRQHNIISNASCTTNSLAPPAKVLHEAFGIKRGLMTTIHSYTNDQCTLDAFHKDLRRARAAAVSIIPTSTGAAEAVTQVIPELAGKLTGLSLRVPTPVVSITDFVVELEKEVSAEDVNKAFEDAAKGKLKGILDINYEPLVSFDYRGNEHSAIIDGLSTTVVDKNLVKIFSWYDNEWGYSRRLVDMLLYVGKTVS